MHGPPQPRLADCTGGLRINFLFEVFAAFRALEVESVKKARKSTGKKVAIWSAVGIGGLLAVYAIGAKATSGGIHSH